MRRNVVLGATAAIVAAGVLGVARLRSGSGFPGAGEPRLEPIDPADRSWLEEVARDLSPEDLRAVVEALPGPRNRFDAPEAMAAAEAEIVHRLRDAGWAAERHAYAFPALPAGVSVDRALLAARPDLGGTNIVALREGAGSGDAVVVLAHYDTVPGTVGADDNTAGVAALLAVARALAPCRFRSTVVLAFTDMEETGLLGGHALVRELQAERRLQAVICFDTMAYTSGEPASQSIPDGVALLFPAQARRLQHRQLRGEFTMVIYNGVATRLAARFAAGLAQLAGPDAVMLLRDPADLPVLGPLLRRLVPAVRNFSRSDHLPFWQAGIPAVFVTDTANFRSAHYHQPTDTPEKLDYRRLACIVSATAAAVAQAAGIVDVDRAGPGGAG